MENSPFLAACSVERRFSFLLCDTNSSAVSPWMEHCGIASRMFHRIVERVWTTSFWRHPFCCLFLATAWYVIYRDIYRIYRIVDCDDWSTYLLWCYIWYSLIDWYDVSCWPVLAVMLSVLPFSILWRRCKVCINVAVQYLSFCRFSFYSDFSDNSSS